MESQLSKDQQEFLLALARKSIKHYLETGKQLKIETQDKIFLGKRGAFVTLKVNGQLRGCIGYPLPYKALYKTVIEMAVSAASKDYRFQPISLEEITEVKIEISVLTLPKPVKDISEIEIGKHGIIISRDSNKGLLLPQVPVEWGWDLETFLRHGCLKAGLEENDWKKGASIEVFSAQVFSE